MASRTAGEARGEGFPQSLFGQRDLTKTEKIRRYPAIPPHPEVLRSEIARDRRSTDLEGGLQKPLRSLEPSFEAHFVRTQMRLAGRMIRLPQILGRNPAQTGSQACQGGCAKIPRSAKLDGALRTEVLPYRNADREKMASRHLRSFTIKTTAWLSGGRSSRAGDPETRRQPFHDPGALTPPGIATSRRSSTPTVRNASASPTTPNNADPIPIPAIAPSGPARCAPSQAVGIVPGRPAPVEGARGEREAEIVERGVAEEEEPLKNQIAPPARQKKARRSAPAPERPNRAVSGRGRRRARARPPRRRGR